MGEIVVAQLKVDPSKIGARKQRPVDWKKQHAILMRQMKEIAGEDGFRIYFISLPRPDIREIADDVPVNLRPRHLKTYKSGEMRPTITVCVAKAKKSHMFFRGVAVCYPLDNPDRLKGRCYAMRKALRAYRDRGDVGVDFTHIGATAFTAGSHIRSEVRDLIRWRPPMKNVSGTWIVGGYKVNLTPYEKKQFVPAPKKR